MNEPKFKVGERWKRRDGGIVIIDIVETDGEDYPICANGYWCDEDGFFMYPENKHNLDLIEKVEPAEKPDHIIEKFKREVFELENSLQAAELQSVFFQLNTLATVARKLYDYEKFIAELKESLKDGDEKRRNLAQKIEEL